MDSPGSRVTLVSRSLRDLPCPDVGAWLTPLEESAPPPIRKEC
ncbi:hypothetical protein ACFFX0_01430 [Citricoccus parietis]|uniref:Uncharacterized protein n=1 Tax=Citricoccus parietis TaxID=592307 RepID=A0ABV5FTC8_9MICC